MKFSEWGYTRPDYSEIKKKINNCKNKMQNALSYQMLGDTNYSRNGVMSMNKVEVLKEAAQEFPL